MSIVLENELLNFTNGNGVWFTSDTHFWHTKVISFGRSAFKTIEEMNDHIIAEWNKRVGPEDTIFHLGDFGWGRSWVPILEQLNGKKYLCVGNHDPHNWRTCYAKYFENTFNKTQIIVEGRHIYLCHEPFLCYGGCNRNEKNAVWQLHGHVHSGPGMHGADIPRMVYRYPYQYDVGVDNNNYAPINYTEVAKIIAQQVEEKRLCGEYIHEV